MKLFYILFLLSITCNISYAINWQEIEAPKTNTVFYVAQKANDVILCGAGIKVSNDSGKTFHYSNNINNFTHNGESIHNNCFLNQYAYITNNGNFIAKPDGAPLLYSTNSGESWEVSNLTEQLSKPKIFEDENGLFLAHRHGFLYSTDDGISWIEVIKFTPTSARYNSYCYTQGIVHLFKDWTYNTPVVHTFDTKSKTLDSLTPEREANDVYTYNNAIYEAPKHSYPNAYDSLLKTTNGGKSWMLELSLEKQILSQLYPDAKLVEITRLIANEGIIWVQCNAKSDSSNDITNYAISTDNGQTFKILDIDLTEFPVYLEIEFYDGNLYCYNHEILRYDNELNNFVPLNYNFPLMRMYRKFDNKEMAWNQSYKGLTKWQKTSNDWEFEFSYSYIDTIITFQGVNFHDIYTDGMNGTNIVYKDILDTNIMEGRPLVYGGNTKFWSLKDGSTLLLLESFNTSYNIKLIHIDKNTITDIITTTYPYADFCLEDNSYKYIDKHDTLYYLVKEYLGESQKDSIKINFNEHNPYIREFYARKNKVIFNTDDFNYLSTDGGETYQIYDNSDFIAKRYKSYIYDDKFYTTSGIGLFRSTDGLTWENLTEEKFDGNISVDNYEFDTESHLYIYTTMGTFKSIDPVSVKEDENNTKTPAISINIYPNPSSDILNFDFNGQVEKTAVVDLNGNIISCPQTLNSLDISELSSGAYFLKVTSNGKTYYRQFVKAE